MNFVDKTVLVTGSSRGIGKATAYAFAEAGAKVAIHYHSNQEAALATLNELPGEGHLLVKADVGNPAQVHDLVQECVREWGQIDILINNAGIFLPHPIDEVDYQEWQAAFTKTLNTNLTGAANLCYCVAQGMMERGQGRIINVTSRGAFRGEPEHPGYGASKAGLNALSQSLALKLGKFGISVYAIAPGFVETDMAGRILSSPAGEDIRQQSPLGRVAKPEEVAYAILFYASEKAKFLTGGILDVNGASYLRS
jgi:NAD(P)-dependent dehydrogenase (short-subunit alcohol dehydrogenase family)